MTIRRIRTGEKVLNEIVSIKRRFCFNCGTKVVEGANFCYHCGLNLNIPEIQNFISSKSVAEAEFIIQEKFLNDDEEIVVRGIVPDKLEIRRNDIMALKKCDNRKFYVDIIRIEVHGKEYAQAKVGQYVDIVLKLSERECEIDELTVEFIDFEDVLIHDLVQVLEIDKEECSIKAVSPGCENYYYIFDDGDELCVMKDSGRDDEKTYYVKRVSEKESLPDIYKGGWGTIIELNLDEVEGLHIEDWLCLVNKHYDIY